MCCHFVVVVQFNQFVILSILCYFTDNCTLCQVLFIDSMLDLLTSLSCTICTFKMTFKDLLVHPSFYDSNTFLFVVQSSDE